MRSRSAVVSHDGTRAGRLREEVDGAWSFQYFPDYDGSPVSLTLPLQSESYRFDSFPAVFEGLLPEGLQLEAVLRRHKIDRNDNFRLLVTLGGDLVGALTFEEEMPEETGAPT